MLWATATALCCISSLVVAQGAGERISYPGQARYLLNEGGGLWREYVPRSNGSAAIVIDYYESEWFDDGLNLARAESNDEAYRYIGVHRYNIRYTSETTAFVFVKDNPGDEWRQYSPAYRSNPIEAERARQEELARQQELARRSEAVYSQALRFSNAYDRSHYFEERPDGSWLEVAPGGFTAEYFVWWDTMRPRIGLRDSSRNIDVFIDVSQSEQTITKRYNDERERQETFLFNLENPGGDDRARQEKLARQIERERLDYEQAQREQAERDRLAREQAERDRLAREQMEQPVFIENLGGGSESSSVPPARCCATGPLGVCSSFGSDCRCC